MNLGRLPLGRIQLRDPRDDLWLTAVWVAMVVHASYISWLAIGRHNNFWTGRFDLGNMVQAIWSTTQGRPLESTDAHGEQFVRLGAHVDPILVLFAPVWSAFPHPEVLLVIQAAAVALGALPVFWLARRWVGSDPIALACVAAYLLYPPLLWIPLTEFHAVAFALPLLVFCVWAIEEDRPAALAICAVLALLTKEHVGLALACLGLWCAIEHRRRLWGALLAAGGLGWTALCMAVIIPRFAPAGGENPFAGRYSHLGGSLTDVPRTMVTDPGLVAQTVFTEPKMLYLVALLAPLAFLPLGSPLLALGALPEILINILTNYWPQYLPQFQYTAVCTPFLVVAAIQTAGRIRDAHRTPLALTGTPLWVGVLVVAALVGGWRQGPLPLWWNVPGGSTARKWEFTADPHTAAMREAVSLIPPGAAVSAVNPYGAHLSDRRRVYSFPVLGAARWVIVDTKRPYVADIMVSFRRFAPYLVQLSVNPRFQRVYARDGVFVYRRVPPAAARPEGGR